MPNFSKNEVILVRVIFANQTGAKIRPAVVVSGQHTSQDALIVPFTSKIAGLLAGEFVLADWTSAGLLTPRLIMP
ncbi:MAG TPA: hypothetical protein VFE46_04815 [Pirellulales bacterium]|jgi:mRNA interferase MazF|nr:hypothetical protein [Pirellulales bacterium]